MSNEQRLHSLDAVRAGALLLGIVLHATMSFLAGFRDMGFPIADQAGTSTALEIVFFVLHIFRMALFFLVAGFFARLLYHRSGLGNFIRNRMRRIALPLVIFYVLVMPLTILPVVWAAKQLVAAGVNLGPGAPPPGFPWGHLWFLYLLLQLYVLVLGLRGLAILVDRGGRLRGLLDAALRGALQYRVAPLLLAAPLAALLYVSWWWPQGAGVPSPVSGFVPNLPSLLAYGGAFLVGWWLHRQQSLFELLRRDWKLYLTVAVASSAVALAVFGTKSSFIPIAMAADKRALYVIAYTLAIWCWTFGLLGAALVWRTAPSARWRYLSDASYWMYLVHLPLVLALQAWMMRWPIHWSLKFVLILAIAGAVLLASYHYLVRSTFLGKLLNGRKYPRGSPAVTSAPSISPG